MAQHPRVTYRYTAYSSDGKRQRGTVAADSAATAERSLWERGLTPTVLDEQEAAPTLRISAGVPTRDLVVVTRQLGTLLGSGVPPFRALTLLRDGAIRRPLRVALDDLVRALSDGQTLAQGLGHHPEIFSLLYRQLVHVGERTGRLEAMLDRLASYLERDGALRSRVRGAMAYPVFILLMAIGVVALVINVTIPSILSILTEFDAPLPMATQILLGVADGVRLAGLPLLGLGLVTALALVIALRRPAFRLWWDALLLRLPLLGPALHQTHLARAADTLSLLLNAGLPLTEVMSLLIASTSNRAMRAALTATSAGTLRGLTFAAALAEAGSLYPSVLISMVQVGEEAGRLPEQLTMLARLYASEADARLSRLIGLVTPVLTILVGGIVLFVAVAMMGAMYAITNL